MLNRLKELRKELGLTQEELGVDPADIVLYGLLKDTLNNGEEE